MRMKPEIRVLGLDDAPFERTDDEVLVVGTIFRGSNFMDGLLSTKVAIDGIDATDKIIDMVNSTRHKPQLKLIMTDGIAFGGFNVIDIKRINKETDLPVVVIIRRDPDMKKIKEALNKMEDGETKIQFMKNAGQVHVVDQKEGKTFFQVAGIDTEDAEKLIKTTSTQGLIPEPIRVAHLIARGVVKGESSGRA